MLMRPSLRAGQRGANPTISRAYGLHESGITPAAVRTRALGTSDTFKGCAPAGDLNVVKVFLKGG
jgi:hypothetical protein